MVNRLEEQLGSLRSWPKEGENMNSGNPLATFHTARGWSSWPPAHSSLIDESSWDVGEFEDRKRGYFR